MGGKKSDLLGDGVAQDLGKLLRGGEKRKHYEESTLKKFRAKKIEDWADEWKKVPLEVRRAMFEKAKIDEVQFSKLSVANRRELLRVAKEMERILEKKLDSISEAIRVIVGAGDVK